MLDDDKLIWGNVARSVGVGEKFNMRLRVRSLGMAMGSSCSQTLLMRETLLI